MTLQQEIARAKAAEAALSARIARLESPYTFEDTFTDLSKWRTADFIGSGQEATFAASQVTVANGQLSITAVRQAPGKWLSGCIVADSSRQLYGRFGARMKIPKGKGGWSAFWMLDKPFPAPGTPGVAEIDIAEILGNPLGTQYGNDASRLYGTLHFPTLPQAQYTKQAVDLSLAFHDFEVEWRKTFLAWLLDGVEFARYTGPGIPDFALPLIIDQAMGGKWAGPTDATTPDRMTLLVDRVWASR